MRRITEIRRLQYIKSREVLRMWPEEDHGRPVEVPRFALLEALGPDSGAAAQPAVPAQYVLVAAVGGVGARSAPSLAVFGREDEAREAFQGLRLRKHPPVQWAQLVSLDRDGRLRTVCWFGSERADGRGVNRAMHQVEGDAAAPDRPRRWRWRRSA